MLTQGWAWFVLFPSRSYFTSFYLSLAVLHAWFLSPAHYCSFLMSGHLTMKNLLFKSIIYIHTTSFNKDIKQNNTFLAFIMIRNMFEHQISILEWFLKDHVTLELVHRNLGAIFQIKRGKNIFRLCKRINITYHMLLAANFLTQKTCADAHRFSLAEYQGHLALPLHSVSVV